MDAQGIRSLKTLTSAEIISLVDLLVAYSRVRVADVSLMESGDMSYRKIEVKLDGSDDLMFRITCSEFPDSEKEVIAFMIEESTDDIYIIPVNRARFTKEFVEPIGVTVDFSIIDQPFRKNYMFFAEELQLWNFAGIELADNPGLTSGEWCVVEEVTITDF